MAKNLDQYSKYFFLAFFILIVVLAFYLIKPFFNPIAGGLFLAYVFYPLHRMLKKIVRYDNWAAALSTMMVLAVIILPLVLMVNMLITEGRLIYNQLNVEAVTSIAGKYLGESVSVTIDQLMEKTAAYIFQLTSSLLFLIPQKIVSFVILLAALFFGFKEGEKRIIRILELVPIKSHYKEKIFAQSKLTLDALIYGIIVTAIVQGIAATLGFYLFGVKAATIWGLITAILAMLPFIGPGVVWVPLALFKLLTGHTWQAIGILLYGLIILTFFLEFVWKNRLIGGKAKIHPAITLLGVIGGLKAFGLMGLIIGPIVLAVFILCIRMFTLRDKK